ncbi:MAG: hypothetical protein SGJ09_01540 [Phycisphaerae bacterium]|nr:hypothetical protein [Phycisphaerae bacterium]
MESNQSSSAEAENESLTLAEALLFFGWSDDQEFAAWGATASEEDLSAVAMALLKMTGMNP